MPQYRRDIRPGTLVHVISRFVNREFRFLHDEERDEYLRLLGMALAKSDWLLIAFVLMSSHIHLAILAGQQPFDHLIRRVHPPFAKWLNARQGRLGPLFASRPRTIETPPVWAAPLVGYHHNNPGRAHAVRLARHSSWSSHNAYVGRSARPKWLNASLGLELMGFGDDPAGRRAFESFVDERVHEPRSEIFTGNMQQANRELRERLEVAVSIEHPTTGPMGLNYGPRVASPRWSGAVSDVVQVAAGAKSITPLAVCGPGRGRSVVAARRLVVLVGRELGCTNLKLGLHLGISESAVRRLATRADAKSRQQAKELLRLVA